MSSTLEIEIKSLLGSEEVAQKLRNSLLTLHPNATIVETSSQLNHYFIATEGKNADELVKSLALLVRPHLSQLDQEKLQHVISTGHNFSVRTRQLAEGNPDLPRVLLVVKASVDDTTSSNGISRLEFEGLTDLSLDKIDSLVQESGFEYQAKWSRQRQAYQLPDSYQTTISLDKNAGYGYLAEFEAVVTDHSQIDATKHHLRQLMDQLNAEELAQDRLERMFGFYNDHWPEYYGTDKIFVIE